MTEKELAAHEAKEKAKAEKRKAEMIAEQDEMRKWPENQVCIININLSIDATDLHVASSFLSCL